ncbi:MAG: hypothetical protein AB7E95_01590 [Kiritimatiellales bacterium]
MVKTLANGTKAIGLFNRNDTPQTVTLNWSDAGLEGEQTFRDLWRQKDIGIFDQKFSADVPSHGVVLVKTGTNPVK